MSVAWPCVSVMCSDSDDDSYNVHFYPVISLDAEIYESTS